MTHHLPSYLHDCTPAPEPEAFSAPSCAQHITNTAESINNPKFRPIIQSNTCTLPSPNPGLPKHTFSKAPASLSPTSRRHHHSALAPTSCISTPYRAGINTPTTHPSRAPSEINRAPPGDQLHTPEPPPSPHSHPWGCNSQPQSVPPLSSNLPPNCPTAPSVIHTQLPRLPSATKPLRQRSTTTI